MLTKVDAKGFIIHKSGSNCLILIHALYKKCFKPFSEHKAEVLHRVCQSGLTQVVICEDALADGIKEQLIAGFEISSESFV